MFKDKKGGHDLQSGNQTIIAQGVRVEGDFHSNGEVIIDGEVAGSVATTMSLQIGESARIQANVMAQSAVIAGEVRGNIKAVDSLDLTSTSKVHGDIQTNLISVAAGAEINGKITMNGGKKGKRVAKVDESVVEQEEAEEVQE
jgi:cytoskeletal protein CcmA (bactofilin family)